MKEINAVERCSRRYKNAVSDLKDLKPIHHSYIFAICNHPGSTQDELSDFISVDKSNITRNLAFLEDGGYIRRIPQKDDKRKILVYPTDKMKEVFPDVLKISKEWNSLLLSNLTDGEKEILSVLLEKLSVNAKFALKSISKGGKSEI